MAHKVKMINFAFMTSHFNTTELREILKGLFIAYNSSDHTPKRTNYAISDVLRKCFEANKNELYDTLTINERQLLARNQR
jgi:hypothetical protein